MKKFIALFLSVLLICLCQMSVYATEVRYTDTSLISALQKFEPSKDVCNLSNVNFSDLEISNPINSYIYSDNGLIESHKRYPIFYNDELVLFAIKVENDNNSYFQITDSLVSIVNSYINNSDELSFVSDKNAIYLYDGSSFIELVYHGGNIEGRAELNNSFFSYSDTQILKTNKLLSTPKKITYSSNMDRSSAVLQGFRKVGKNTEGYNNTSNLCWSASIASMLNYRYGVYYNTAVSVAQTYFGSTTNFNRDMDFDDEAQYALHSFNFIYTYNPINYDEPQYVNVAYRNIASGKPIYTHTNVGRGCHAVVIYGASINGNYLSIMDPEGNGGLYTAYYGDLPTNIFQDGYFYYNEVYEVYITLVNSLSQYVTS